MLSHGDSVVKAVVYHLLDRWDGGLWHFQVYAHLCMTRLECVDHFGEMVEVASRDSQVEEAV